MIKYPGGEIAFWTSVWIVVGVAVAILTLARGQYLLAAVAATLPIACVLIWIDVRPAKWLVVACLGLAALGALAVLCLNGFSIKTFAQGVLAVYSAISFAVWQGGPTGR